MAVIKKNPKAHVASKGKGKAGGGGGWLWLPAGFGGMMASPFMAKGKGKGAQVVDKTKEKLRKFDASKKVWVGGMSKTTTWKKLEKHVRETADLKPAVVDVNEKKGTGVICFKNEDDVSTAVAVLNGTELDGNSIEVDVWTKTEKPPKEDGDEDKPKKKKQQPKKTQLKVKKPVSKVAEKLKEIDPSLKVWVGGLTEKTTFKELSKHFEDLFAKPKLVDILAKGGRAVVTYESADDVASAVSIVNGSELNGNTIEVDVWTKPEKKEKVKKETAE
jgi:RNA recognition motif-containing protein